MTSPSDAKLAPAGLPEGFIPVPLTPGYAASPLRICAIVRRQPDPAAGHLVTIRDLVDGRVLLGCVTDAAGRIQRWLEIWVQDLTGLAAAPAAAREALNNDLLDTRRKRQVAAFEKLDPIGALTTGWETVHPAPAFINLATFEPAALPDGWALCTDDALLTARGLPAYTRSLHRYLCQPTLKDQSPFVPVTADAPTAPGTKSLADVAGGAKLLPVNPGGGLMAVRSYGPVGYEEFLDVLGGGSFAGLAHGRTPVHVGVPEGSSQHNADASGDGWLFLNRSGKWGRLIEGFHLRLRMLADAFEQVRDLVRATPRPLLNLSADSFRVRLGEAGCGLPVLWTVKPVLADPGDAVELPIKASDVRYHLPARPQASVYRPAQAGQTIGARAAVRIRQVMPPDAAGGVNVEGTFTTNERLDVGRNDLAWLRLNVANSWLDLYARLESTRALAAGEWRFRTVGHKFKPEVVQALKAAEGVPMNNVLFEIVPLLSTPVDLYALGVLGARTLLVNPATNLPVAVDELLSLARQVQFDQDPNATLPQRVRAVFGTDARWRDSLGPQRLSNDPMTAEEAFDLIPADVWFDTLAALIRTFPGVGPDSTCRDFGDAPGGGLHRVFEPALVDLNALIVKTRSLIVIDWKFNREIHAVIRGTASGI